MKQAAGARAACEDEPAQRRDRAFERIDPSFQTGHVRFVQQGLLHARGNVMAGIRHHGADGEQVLLQVLQQAVDLGIDTFGACESEPGVQFIDVAVRVHARVGLADASAIEEACLALVAGLRIDLQRHTIIVAGVKKSLPLPAPARRQWFRRRLLDWYRRNGRDLPWRNTRDPYHILVSEMMLQQTQVDRVLPKYHEWLGQYPSLEALAEAPETDVVRTWYPLGYNIRPRRLQAIARESVEKYGGGLPDDEETLLSFKGIGQYTAGAVMSFAFGKRAAILDTNVARVLFRVFVGKGAPKSHQMVKHLWAVSRTVLPYRNVFDFNQALMDFGATVCTARAPLCTACGMKRGCASYPLTPKRVSR
jgi:A/G-specific adenine glycosylase